MDRNLGWSWTDEQINRIWFSECFLWCIGSDRRAKEGLKESVDRPSTGETMKWLCQVQGTMLGPATGLS